MWKLLVPSLGHTETEVRLASLGALVQFAEPESHDAIIDMAAAEKDGAVRVQLCLAARKLKLKPLIPTLIEWLEDEAESVIMGAANALRDLSGQNLGTDAAKWTAWWEKNKKE